MTNLNVLFIAGFLLMGLACYGLLITRHMLKLIAVLQIMGKAVLILFLAVAQVNGKLALAQSLMFSLIAVETMFSVLALALAVQIFQRTGTMDIRALSRLKG